MPTVATIVSFSLVALFVILSLWESGLFKWHPSLMSVSYLGCMFQAIYVFAADESSRSRSLTRRKQILIHSLLQLGTIVSALIAFVTMYMSKEQRNKPHFVSWHGFIGLIAVVWSVLQAAAGLLLTVLQQYIHSLGLTYAQLRIYHATSGVLLFTLSCAVLVLGLASNWFKSKMPSNTFAYWAIFYLLTSSMLFLAHKCVEQVKNRYVKRKSTAH